MRLPLLLFASLSAAAQAQTFDPAAQYVTAGQDEPGYRAWYMASPERAVGVAGLNQYLTLWGVAGVVPTWQLLRTASDWSKCGAQPFEVPPTTEWPNVVQTLRYIRDQVVPAIGPVEAVSGYRNPALNACAGGARASAHVHYYALDLVPLRPTTREDLIRAMCIVHYREGEDYEAGLGFYAFLRFHVDSKAFREWGGNGRPESSPCVPIEAELEAARTANPAGE